MLTVCVSLAISLVWAGMSYAQNCSTSFDQTCLSRPYNQKQIESDQLRRQQDMEAFNKEQEALTAKRAKEQQETNKVLTEERRHREQLKAQKDIKDAINSQDTSPVINIYIPR